MSKQLRRPKIVILSLAIATIALTIALVAISCGQPAPAPGPSPAEVTPTIVPEPGETTVITASPEPDAERTAPESQVGDRMDLPPVAVETSPSRGEEHPLDAPIRVSFNQAMDPSTTKRAFSIQPEIAGVVLVEGQELVFTPSEPLERGQAYMVRVGDAAQGINGKLLAAPVQLPFSAVGFLQVTSSQPSDGSQEVNVDTTITVVFNRPVVPLTSIEAMADLPEPLRFDPAVNGSGEWLNTSIYAFRPDQALAGSTDYTITVSSGLQDTKGSLLAEDHVFSFRTAEPIVTQIEPSGNEVAPTTAITVTFSQPMDPVSTEEAFSLRESGSDTAIEGNFAWPGLCPEDVPSENPAPAETPLPEKCQGRVLEFRPADPLQYAANYVAEVADSARSALGQGRLRSATTQRFQTTPIIAIVRTEPADGETSVAPETAFYVRFQGLVNEKTLGREAFSILPEPTQVFSYYTSYENQWVITWPLGPQTNYTVTLASSIGDRLGNTLGQEQVIRFRTGNRRPFAHLNVPNEIGTYNAYTNTLMAVSYRNVSRLDFALYEVDERAAERLLGPNQWEARRVFRPQSETLVREWSVPATAEVNANILEKIPLAEDGGALAPGIYWIEMRAPEVSYRTDLDEPGQEVPRHLLIVSPLNLLVKQAADEVLVWATDLQSGQPVGELPIRVTGRSRVQGSTGNDGIFRSAVSDRDPWLPLTIFSGEPGFNYGVVSTDWQQGIGPWEFSLMSEFAPSSWQGYFYSDRPLYRPGQTIYWKGIIRADDDAIYALPPAGTQLNVIIRDGQGNEIYQEAHETSPFGTIHGDLPLDEEAGLGYYYLEAQLLGLPADAPYIPMFSLGFQVAEYRKPEFEATLETDRDEYLQGDSINATVEATFFFGGPVSKARVEWSVFTEDALFSYAPEEPEPLQTMAYSFNDFTGWDSRRDPRYGGLVTSGSGETDAQGRFTFQIPADISDRLQSQRFRIETRIIDLSNQEVSTGTSALVHKGLIYAGLAPRSYVARVGQPSQVDLITVDWDSRSVPTQELEVVVNRAEWITVQEKGEDGQFYWVTQVKETPILTDTVTTGSNGQATFTWTPEEGGQYKINASVTDNRGNTQRGATFVWVTAQADTYVSWRIDNNDRIELVADKELYQVGETAKVLVPHPYQGDVEALLTIERGGILEARQLTLTGNSETVAIPVDDSYVPNVFVSVVVVKGQGTDGTDLGSFKLGYAELPVAITPKELQVTLTPDRKELRPGETVNFTVQVRDHEDNPVEAEFSLALVDKALLSLSQGQESTLLDTFYRRRGVGILTASTLVYNLDRLNQQLQEGAKGGGGGGGEAAFFADVRSEFEDAVLWEPTLVTDANGQAEVSVKLPDNLTTWRLDGRGITVNTEVGQATVEVVTTLPLLVRPVLPRFFTTGDEAQIGTVVLNNTDTSRQVRVSLDLSNLATDAETTHEVSVPAGEQVRLTWPVTVLAPAPDEAVGDAIIRFTALEIDPPGTGDPLSDAVELTLPVYRYSSPETVGTAGTVALGEERLEVIVLPPSVDPSQGDLRVRLEPSLAAGMIESLDWLEHYPYECNEQIVSAFLPNVATYRALAALEIDDPQLRANLGEQIGTAVQKLVQRQNADGGWGWWGGEESRAFVSSYVVFGLVEAEQAGFFVDPVAIERGTGYLSRQLKAVDGLRPWQLNQQAFMLYVLAEAGRGDMGRTVALYDVRERLGHYGRAYLALAFEALQETAGESASAVEPRIATLLGDLQGAAILSATGAHWEETSRDHWTMNSDTRSTSLALSALARLSPEAEGEIPGAGLGPNVVRWLMVTRKDGIWQSTQENVWAIIGLTDWMVATKELDADYSYRVSLNDQLLAEGSVDSDNVDEPVDLRVEVRNLLLDAANGLAIGRYAENNQTGDGQLYYTAHLSYYLPAAELDPMDRGVVLSRQYALVDPLTGKMTTGPVTAAQINQTVQVTLTIIAPNDLYYLVVESPLPAGAEAIDPSLATTSDLYQDPGLQPQETHAYSPWTWWWTPTFTELRDEKVVLFATELPAGTYQYTYQMRTSLPGSFQTLPATAYEMYFPEVWGRSAGGLFTITGE